ncbi:hypothetical protein ACFV1N_17020 [Streptosporangium canum]|uniref:hypothetical protein n=1 Tax=Streptosporangium canum TaxID=324952 RepID=UPI00368BB5C3
MGTKSVAQKLLIKPDTAVWSSDSSYLELIQPLPENVHQADGPDQAATALIFAQNAGSLRDILSAQEGRLGQQNALWVAYPKANRADINRESLATIMVEHGMRPIGQVSLDDVWSAMRFRPAD